jgi:hypothetical protein
MTATAPPQAPRAVDRMVVAAVAVPAVISVAAAVAMLFAPADDLARTLPVEDAYYALSVARQVAIGGGITIDGAVETNGFQPLWVGLNVPLYALVDGDRIAGLRLSQILATLLWLAFVPLLALQARDLARRHGLSGTTAAAAAAIVAVGSVSVLRVFRNGLETGLTLLLLAAAVILLDRWTNGRRAAADDPAPAAPDDRAAPAAAAGDRAAPADGRAAPPAAAPVDRAAPADERPSSGWTLRRVVLAGLLLGALAWARLDAAMFAVAFAAVMVWRSRRGAAPALAACVLAALVLVPWLAYNVALDGSPMPSGGQAQARAHNLPHNLDSALRAVGSWTLAPVLRASMHTSAVPIVEVLAAGGIALTVLAFVLVRRGRRVPLGAGTLALGLYVAFLLVWYVFAFGAWWFLDRYLSPILVLAVPWLAVALERLGRRWALPALAGTVVVANLPVLIVLLGSPTWPPPAWSARESNLGSHPNLNYESQLAWTRANVQPACRVGAFESGTLGYFRDNVVNLDGKVNPDALQAKLDGRSPEYIDRVGIQVLVDIHAGIRRSDAADRGWRQVTDQGRYEAWVRPNAEGCLR